MTLGGGLFEPVTGPGGPVLCVSEASGRGKDTYTTGCRSTLSGAGGPSAAVVYTVCAFG